MKGVVFRCISSRTVVHASDIRPTEIMRRNERDDVLCKMSNDPRVPRLGHILPEMSH